MGGILLACNCASINLKAVLCCQAAIKSKILDKNIQAKYLEIGRTQASVIAFQVEYLVIIFSIKMGVFRSV